MPQLHDERVAHPSGSQSSPASFRISTSDDVLREALHPGVNVAVWNRTLPADLGRMLARWAAGAPAAFDATVDLAEPDLDSPLGDLPDDAWRSWMHADLSGLVARFVAITGVTQLRLAFGPVTTDQCRKFHVDWVRYRLVTTYLGPGTQWVSNQHASRDALELPPVDAHDHNRRVVRDYRRVRQAATGAVLLMKGESGGGSSGGAIHRSPPVEAQRLRRVVLVLTAS